MKTQAALYLQIRKIVNRDVGMDRDRQRRHEIMFIFSFLGAVLVLVGFALGVIEK